MKALIIAIVAGLAIFVASSALSHYFIGNYTQTEMLKGEKSEFLIGIKDSMKNLPNKDGIPSCGTVSLDSSVVPSLLGQAADWFDQILSVLSVIISAILWAVLARVDASSKQPKLL